MFGNMPAHGTGVGLSEQVCLKHTLGRDGEYAWGDGLTLLKLKNYHSGRERGA